MNLNAFWYAPRKRNTTYDYTGGAGSGSTVTSDYFMVNLRADQKLFKEHLNLYAGVRNLLNSFSFVKSDAGQTMQESFGTVEGITLYVGMKYTW